MLNGVVEYQLHFLLVVEFVKAHLSSVIFNVFVNIFIVKLKLLATGRHIPSIFVGGILYADDINCYVAQCVVYKK